MFTISRWSICSDNFSSCINCSAIYKTTAGFGGVPPPPHLPTHTPTHAHMTMSCLTGSKVLDRLDRLGQVAEELGHAGGEEGVDHGAREEPPQVCLEEGEHLGAVGFPEKKKTQPQR